MTNYAHQNRGNQTTANNFDKILSKPKTRLERRPPLLTKEEADAKFALIERTLLKAASESKAEGDQSFWVPFFDAAYTKRKEAAREEPEYTLTSGDDEFICMAHPMQCSTRYVKPGIPSKTLDTYDYLVKRACYQKPNAYDAYTVFRTSSLPMEYGELQLVRYAVTKTLHMYGDKLSYAQYLDFMQVYDATEVDE